MKRGDIFLADLSVTVGSEQGGMRPILVIQNDVGNRFSPTVIVACITSQISKKRLPTHIELNASKYGLIKDSVILTEQLRTIDKSRLTGSKIASLDNETMQKVNEAIGISLGISELVPA